MAQGRKTGGRRKGSLNKATAKIKATLQKHGDELVDALLALTRSDDEHVRLKALQVCLDRAYGRPAQAVQVGADPDSIPVVFHMDFGAGLKPPTSRKFSA